MGSLGRALRALSPHSLLRLYMAVVVAAAALAIGAVLWTTSAVDSHTRKVASMANAATAASQVQAGLREPLMVLLLNTTGFVLSADGLDGLSEAQRMRVLQAVSSALAGAELASDALPDVSIPMSEREAVTLTRSIELSSSQIDELVAGEIGVDLTRVVEQRGRLLASTDAYFVDGSATNFAALFSDVLSLGEELDAAEDQLTLAVVGAQSSLNRATSDARLVMLAALVFLTALMGVATFLTSRLISRAFWSSENEREALGKTSETLRYRNDQLNALYTVFTEITDTLSMRYVISATLRETLRVMNGYMVVLRLMRGGELVVAGNLTSEGKEVPNLPVLSLGDGPVGRVARRGRGLRIDRDAQAQFGSPLNLDGPTGRVVQGGSSLDPDDKRAQMGPPPDLEQPNSGVESGVIAPLIVGARVIGTLAVWSREPDAFTDEDEHVLEMMASQVATAVAAANNAESSERRALHDSLTGLPNRRQLSEDIVRHRGSLDGGGVAAVAMVDVDNFKSVNDEYGHRVGDIALQKIASVLRSAVRDGDMIYRYGGEEFVAIFKDAAGQDARTAAERLRKAVEATPITGEQLPTARPITISIGLARMPDHGTDISQLIEKADRAMYQAKDLGRNRVQVWEEEPPARGDLPSVA